MPLFIDSARFGSAAGLNAGNCISIGFVNNMPDVAVEATERQFVDLIRRAAPDAIVLLKLFAIPELPRSDATRTGLADRYRDISELWNTPLDGLIVTGTEPRAKNLKDEPYWQTLCAIADWARGHTASTIWSCLAAHAAALHADGVERRPLKQKLFGTFACALAADHPMTYDVTVPFMVPHSRYNDLPARTLKAAGYKILSQSPEAGVDIFAKQDNSLFLFFQGHLEYDSGALLREYRRDAVRFLAGERDKYPAMPLHYFNDEAAALADAFSARARAERGDALIGEFPKAALETGLGNPWRQSALGIYRKWTAYLRARKAEQRPLGAPSRRTWRDWPLALGRASESSAR
jgi:homoserine O-succinyltransferase